MRPEDITFEQKMTELRLDISHPKSQGQAFILVEGSSDIRLFRKLFDTDACNVEYLPGGKGKLEEGIAILSEIYGLIIGIKDADFYHLQEGEMFDLPNIFLTDYHDLEMTMLAQREVVKALLSEYTTSEKSKHLDYRNKILQKIKTISCFKWLNIREVLKFKFKNVGFQDLVSFADSNAVDITQYIQRVLSNSSNAVLTDIEEIKIKINELLDIENVDLLQLTNGHDALKSFAVYLRKEHSCRGLSDKDLASSLRIASSLSIFKRTDLYQKINEWAIEKGVTVYDDDDIV